MADILLFTPRHERDAEANLREFTDTCRTKLTALGPYLPFDAFVWDITSEIPRKGKRTARTLTFSSLASCGTKNAVAMGEPFCSFAKAYLRYQHAMRPVKGIDIRLSALRVLEAALNEFGLESTPWRLGTDVLNRAAQLCGERYGKDSAYNVAHALQETAAFMLEHQLVSVPFTWAHGMRKAHLGQRVGKEFDEHRAEKLPSGMALDALAQIFHLVKSPGDTLVSAVTAILCSAPDRINELLLLPLECEARQRLPKKDEEAYGLRWWPAKGALPMIKWVIPSMTDTVQEAIRRIRELTEEGRALAKWYEAHPKQLYLPKQLDYLRKKEWLSMPELGMLLFEGDCHSTSPLAWVRAVGLEPMRDMQAKSRPNYVRFADVEKHVLSMLPQGFPVLDPKTGLKYSDALCVIARNALNDTRATFQCMLDAITYSDIQARLGNTASARSLFDTYGFTEEDGSPIQVSTHQFRHYLNTLAQRGGLSQMDIAKWSGRRDVRQNAAYDHVSGQELVAQMRALVGDEQRMPGPLSASVKMALIPRDEFARLKIPTAHTTDFGFCVHDFTMSPCQLHRDCMSCEELVCVKGDAVRAARIRVLRDDTQALLASAQQAEAEQDAGASRWVEHQSAVLARLDQLCTIFDDSSVPDGSFIQQAQPQTPSRLQQAAEARAALLGDTPLRALLTAPTTRGTP